MPIGANIGLFKILGLFGTGIIVILFLGGAAIGLAKAFQTGDWTEALKVTGGRIFAVDSALHKEADFLLSPDNEGDVFLNLFHISYSMTLVFMLFFVGFLLFKIGNWLIGIKQFSPSSDIMIILVIIIGLLALQYSYTHYILGETHIPLSGIWRFVTEFPKIVQSMI